MVNDRVRIQVHNSATISHSTELLALSRSADVMVLLIYSWQNVVSSWFAQRRSHMVKPLYL